VELTLEAWSHAIFGDTDTVELDHMDLVDGFPVARSCEWTCARYFYEGVEKHSASKASCCDQMDMRLTYTTVLLVQRHSRAVSVVLSPESQKLPSPSP
jgi:hypothetical protein